MLFTSNLVENFLIKNGLFRTKITLGIPIETIILGFLIALILVKVHFLWKYFSRFIISIIHEAGHGLFALLLTRKAPRINLHHDTTGQTWSYCGNGFKRLLITMAGYPFPSTLAILGGYLMGMRLYKDWFVFLLILLIVELVFLIRNFFGILLVSFVLLIGYFVWKTTNLATIQLQLIGVVIVLLLGLGGFETAREVVINNEANSDLEVVSSFLHVSNSLAGKALLFVVLVENFLTLYLLYK